MGMSRLVRSVAIGSICLLVPAVAGASNGTHQRTPVQWEGTAGSCELSELAPQCMTLVDRSDEAVLHVPYRIPYPDTAVTPDEVADSRRHQFFALCRQHDQPNYLPNWISNADVAAAEAKRLIDAANVTPEEIMEDAPDWAGCWSRIIPDAERRPIVCEMAAAGVDWDTATVPAGVYALEGFTHEPPFNVWVQRPGVVKVHDGDPDAVGPAAAISTRDLTPYRDDVVTIEGCVNALPGTTFTVSWALAGDAVEWIEYEADLPIAGDSFSFEFAPPAELVGGSGVIKADFTDPMDRTYTAHMIDGIIVIDLDNPNGCGEDGGGFIGGPCAEDSGSGEGSGTGDEGTTGDVGDTGNADAGSDDTDATTVPMDDGGLDPKTCGCTTSDRGAAPLLVLFGGLLLRRRRRSESAHSRRLATATGARRRGPHCCRRASAARCACAPRRRRPTGAGGSAARGRASRGSRRRRRAR